MTASSTLLLFPLFDVTGRREGVRLSNLITKSKTGQEPLLVLQPQTLKEVTRDHPTISFNFIPERSGVVIRPYLLDLPIVLT